MLQWLFKLSLKHIQLVKNTQYDPFPENIWSAAKKKTWISSIFKWNVNLNQCIFCYGLEQQKKKEHSDFISKAKVGWAVIKKPGLLVQIFFNPTLSFMNILTPRVQSVRKKIQQLHPRKSFHLMDLQDYICSSMKQTSVWACGLTNQWAEHCDLNTVTLWTKGPVLD